MTRLRSFIRSGVMSGGFSFVNAEAAAIVAQMTTEPTDARKAIIDNLVGALKAAGVWTQLDVFFIFAAHDNQASRLNWKNPGTGTLTISGTLGTTITFVVDDGWAGSHISNSAWLDTDIAPNAFTHYTQNDASMGVFFKNTQPLQAGNDGNVIGSTTTAKNSMIPLLTFPTNDGKGNIHGIDNTLITFNPAAATISGLVVVDRNSSTTIRLSHNGVQRDTSPSTSATPESTGTIIFLAQPGQAGTAVRISAGFLGGSLTDAEQLAMYNALNTYMAGL